jgi:hypothetical protein
MKPVAVPALPLQGIGRPRRAASHRRCVAGSEFKAVGVGRLVRGRSKELWCTVKTALKSLADRTNEWFSSLVMIAWAATMALPGDLLSQPGFVAFHRFGMTEAIWSFLFAFVGTARSVAFYINGRWPRSPHIRMIGALFGAVSWIPVSVLLYEAAGINNIPITTGCAVYALLAAFELFSINRAAFYARYH